MYLLQGFVGSQVYYYSNINFKAKESNYNLFILSFILKILVILLRAVTSVIFP